MCITHKKPSHLLIRFLTRTLVTGGTCQCCFLSSSLRCSAGQGMRALSPQSAPLLSRPCPCFVALHVLSFLSRNKIFYQIQIYRAFLNTEDLFHLAYHQQDFQEF